MARTGIPGNDPDYPYLTYRDVAELEYRCAIYVRNNPSPSSYTQFINRQLERANVRASRIGACSQLWLACSGFGGACTSAPQASITPLLEPDPVLMH
jgi:hypothetical protein